MATFFRDLPEFLASSVQHEGNSLSIKVEFYPFNENTPVITKKKKAPSEILRNRRRLQKFLETRNEPHTSVKDTGSERELGESIFETPLNRPHEGAVQEFQAETECTYIGSVEFHQLENEDSDICHMETGAYSAASAAGGQILNDESEDNGDNEVDDCDEKTMGLHVGEIIGNKEGIGDYHRNSSVKHGKNPN